MKNIPSPGFSLHEALPHGHFGSTLPKPTVTILPILGERIAMVCPLGVEGWWVPPQGSIRMGETPLHAAFRVLQSKLHMNHEELVRGRSQALCRFTNLIPEGRCDAGLKKEHYVVGVKLATTARIGLNKEMFSNINFVSTPQHLEALLHAVAQSRPVKHGGTVRAIAVANALHMLPWSVEIPQQAPEMVH